MQPASWPLAARGQQPEPMRRIGVLMQIAEGDAESKIQVAEFLRELRELGWVVGHNVKLDTRWAGGDSDRIRKYAADLVALAPDGVLASHRGGSIAAGEQHRTDRVRNDDRPGGGRLRREFGAAGGQRHRF